MAFGLAPAKLSLNPLRWVGLSIMDRYILGELIMPFLFGVGAFSSIGVAIGVLFDLMRRITEAGLSPWIALEIFFLKLPYFISLSLPMSLLLACLMVYGRLSNDSELIALRSCGVSAYRLVMPALMLGLLLTGVFFMFNEAVVPAANRQASYTLERALKGKDPTSFRERDILYKEFAKLEQEDGQKGRALSRLFYAKEFDGEQMKGLTILDFSQAGLNQIVAAKTATWNVDQKTWDFYDGTIYVIDPNGSYRNIVRFDRQQLQLPRAPLDIAKTSTDPIEMSITQIRDYLATVGDSGDEKEVRKLKLRIDQKISLPFACLMFGLVGATLGVSQHRRGKRATGFGISLILIVSYYLATSVCEAFYSYDVLSPFLAAWLPTLIGFAAGISILIRHNR
jgi:lipopolysaccharide export system permease protein